MTEQAQREAGHAGRHVADVVKGNGELASTSAVDTYS
jgi:hypothetical protein